MRYDVLQQPELEMRHPNAFRHRHTLFGFQGFTPSIYEDAYSLYARVKQRVRIGISLVHVDLYLLSYNHIGDLYT